MPARRSRPRIPSWPRFAELTMMTLLLLSTPLYILYEITILAVRFILKK